MITDAFHLYNTMSTASQPPGCDQFQLYKTLRVYLPPPSNKNSLVWTEIAVNRKWSPKFSHCRQTTVPCPSHPLGARAQPTVHRLQGLCGCSKDGSVLPTLCQSSGLRASNLEPRTSNVMHHCTSLKAFLKGSHFSMDRLAAPIIPSNCSLTRGSPPLSPVSRGWRLQDTT